MLRGLALALLLFIPLLSGCLFVSPPTARLDAEPDAQSLVFDPPAVASRTGALGFWVPDDATSLVVAWDLTGQGSAAASEGGRGAKSHGRDTPGLLGGLDDLLAVIGPDGERLFVGTPQFRTTGTSSDGNDTANGSAPRLPKGVAYATFDPAPGLYRMIRYGSIALPQIRLEAPTGTIVPTPAPLPVTLTRTTVLGGPSGAGAPLDAQGTWTPPTGTIAVWIDLSGVGSRTVAVLHTAAGDMAASIRYDLVADARMLGGGFGLAPFWYQQTSDPQVALDGPLQWTVNGEGTGYVYALAAVVGTMPEPYAPADPIAEDAETVHMEGDIRSGRGAALRLPADSHIVLRLQSTDEYVDHSTYRVYDATGERLAWGSLATPTSLQLPAGPIAIINDGPGTLEVDIVGTPPADATLHELEVTSTHADVELDANDGGDEASIRLDLKGPGRAIQYQYEDTLSDVWVQLVRADGTPIAVAPEPPGGPSSGGYCCNFPFLGGGSGDAAWADPGIHHIDLRAEAGRGTITAYVASFDLGALLELA